MQIAGNGSGPAALNWFQDRVAETYPRAWVLSVPLWCYRALMLAWALWLIGPGAFLTAARRVVRLYHKLP